MSAICAGSTVTVHDPRGDWTGYVRQLPDGPYFEGEPLPPGVISVLDPRESGLEPHTVWSVPQRRIGCPSYPGAAQCMPAGVAPEVT